MIGPQYDYALVGSGSDNYLWILSRTPYLPDNVVREILQNAKERGYNTDNLIWVKQK
jgi:lipocalin